MRRITRAPRRTRSVILIGLAAVAALALVGTVAAGSGRTVRATGSEKFIPNAMIMATLRFAPGPLEVSSGDSVTWSDDSGDPHTVSVVDAADVPTDIDEVFTCAACGVILAGHLGTTPPTPVLGGGLDGLAGFDGPGDSLFLPPNGSVSALITAPSGATLNYLCAIHPWMIGTINVR
jgi:plastocyanin